MNKHNGLQKTTSYKKPARYAGHNQIKHIEFSDILPRHLKKLEEN
jgi:hypothetical protein